MTLHREGVSFRFFENKKALYIHYIITGHSLMSLPCLVGSLLSAIQLLVFPGTESLFNFGLAFTQWVICINTAWASYQATSSIVKEGNDRRYHRLDERLKRAQGLAGGSNSKKKKALYEEDDDDEDRSDDGDEGEGHHDDNNEDVMTGKESLEDLLALKKEFQSVQVPRRWTLAVMWAQVALHTLYYVVLFGVRLPTSWTSPVTSGDFAAGLVSGTVYNIRSDK